MNTTFHTALAKIGFMECGEADGELIFCYDTPKLTMTVYHSPEKIQVLHTTENAESEGSEEYHNVFWALGNIMMLIAEFDA